MQWWVLRCMCKLSYAVIFTPGTAAVIVIEVRSVASNCDESVLVLTALGRLSKHEGEGASSQCDTWASVTLLKPALHCIVNGRCHGCSQSDTWIHLFLLYHQLVYHWGSAFSTQQCYIVIRTSPGLSLSSAALECCAGSSIVACLGTRVHCYLFTCHVKKMESFDARLTFFFPFPSKASCILYVQYSSWL